eukprot:1195205-Prorocentrum_minimum.AAC.4
MTQLATSRFKRGWACHRTLHFPIPRPRMSKRLEERHLTLYILPILPQMCLPTRAVQYSSTVQCPSAALAFLGDVHAALSCFLTLIQIPPQACRPGQYSAAPPSAALAFLGDVHAALRVPLAPDELSTVLMEWGRCAGEAARWSDEAAAGDCPFCGFVFPSANV